MGADCSIDENVPLGGVETLANFCICCDELNPLIDCGLTVFDPTGAVRNPVAFANDFIEISMARKTERGGRTDDKRSETSMEDRKKKGYF